MAKTSEKTIIEVDSSGVTNQPPKNKKEYKELMARYKAQDPEKYARKESEGYFEEWLAKLPE